MADYKTIKEASKMLNKSNRTIQRWLKDGTLSWYDERQKQVDVASIIAVSQSKNIKMRNDKTQDTPQETNIPLQQENAVLKERVAGLTDRLRQAEQNNDYLKEQNTVLLRLSAGTTQDDKKTTEHDKQRQNTRQKNDIRNRILWIVLIIGVLSLVAILSFFVINNTTL